MYYKLIITETSRNSLKEKPIFFNEIVEDFANKDLVCKFLIDRYGVFPKGKHKIYIDDLNGSRKETGFLHSYWNRDCSHDSKAWYQTDWIAGYKINSIPIKHIDLLKNI